MNFNPGAFIGIFHLIGIIIIFTMLLNKLFRKKS